jgi:hypothetical protein
VGAAASGAAAAGDAARIADVRHSGARDITAPSTAPCIVPPPVRALIRRAGRCDRTCTSVYFFSMATPKIKATVQVYD